MNCCYCGCRGRESICLDCIEHGHSHCGCSAYNRRRICSTCYERMKLKPHCVLYKLLDFIKECPSDFTSHHFRQLKDILKEAQQCPDCGCINNCKLCE